MDIVTLAIANKKGGGGGSYDDTVIKSNIKQIKNDMLRVDGTDIEQVQFAQIKDIEQLKDRVTSSTQSTLKPVEQHLMTAKGIGSADGIIKEEGTRDLVWFKCEAGHKYAYVITGNTIGSIAYYKFLTQPATGVAATKWEDNSWYKTNDTGEINTDFDGWILLRCQIANKDGANTTIAERVADTEYSAVDYVARNNVEEIKNSVDKLQGDIVTIKTEQVEQDNRLDALESRPVVDKSLTRRVENLEAAAKGYLYREDVNDNEAYEKTVSSDVMPWATLDCIGGKTIVMNQLIGDTCPKTVEGEMYEQVIEDEAVSVSIDSIGGRTIVWNQLSHIIDAYTYGTPLVKGTRITAGHKFLLFGDVILGEGASIEPQIYLYTKVNGENKVIGNSVQGNRYAIFESGYNAESDGTSAHNGTCWIYCNLYGGAVKAIQLFDLTQMFGEGNEPTADGFRMMFPAKCYPYSAPTLMSFGVNEVVSRGRNLIDTTNIYYKDGSGVTRNLNDDGTVFMDGTAATTTYVFFGKQVSNDCNIHLTPGIYTLSLRVISGSVEGATLTAPLAYKLDGGQYTIGTLERLDGETITVNITEENDYFVYLRASAGAVFHNVVVSVVLSRGRNANNPFSPYVSPSRVDISTLVRQFFPAGMKSAGSVYDELDLQNSKAIQRVGSITFTGASGEAWTYGGTNEDGSDRYYANSVRLPGSPNTSVQYGLLCNLPESRASSVSNGQTIIGYGVTWAQFRYRPSSIVSIDEWVASLKENPITVYYELEEPIITDIDLSILTGHEVGIEKGGTLSFQNDQSDKYRLPVMTKITLLLSKWMQMLDATHKYSMNGTLVGSVGCIDVIGGTDSVIDLTRAFGAGKEPNAEELRGLLPADFYPYCEPKLVSFAPMKVKSHGRNLYNGNLLLAPVGTTGRYIYLYGFNSASTGVDAGQYLDAGDYTVTINTGCKPNSTVVTGVYGAIDKGNLITFVGNGSSTIKTFTFKLSKRSKINMWVYFGGSIDFRSEIEENQMWVQIQKGATALPYIPSHAPVTYTYADLVQKYFPEGMHSAGNAYDEIDLERKAAIKRVGCVDLGTLTWVSKVTSDIRYFESNEVEGGITCDPIKRANTILCSRYVSRPAAVSEGATTGIAIYTSVAMPKTNIRIFDATYNTASNLKSALSGVMLYYELAEPIETPIAPEDLDGLTDINVEPGGSLVFINGDDENYRIPLPNQETYMIKLGGATNE